MDEITPLEHSQKRLEGSKITLDAAEWKLDENRREELLKYKNTLKTTLANSSASKYIPIPNTVHDLTKASKALKIRCMMLNTNQFEKPQKVPIDRILMCLQLAEVSVDDPSKVYFPYGFTNDNKENVITNVFMNIEHFESLTREIGGAFDKDMVYNQTVEQQKEE
ncbi:TPA: hypothetical protein DEP90_02890 [Patescibacteria group bacterium]|nr:hypothetical protein [Patescibacteria group bacterium]